VGGWVGVRARAVHPLCWPGIMRYYLQTLKVNLVVERRTFKMKIILLLLVNRETNC
jgi:hypothetical protein